MAFDNARILNCYKLRAFILLSMSGCLKKQVVYLNSFHGLRLVDLDPFWFFYSDSQGRSAFVAVVYKNKLLAKETDR